MTIQEAFKLISEVSPCWDCKYKSSSCNRSAAHVWKDGFCHEFDEALLVLSELIPESVPEPEPEEPEPDGDEDDDNGND